MGIAASADEG